MSSVLRDGLQKLNDIIKEDKAGLPPNAGKDDVESTLEGGWDFFEGEGHPCVPARAELCSRLGLVLAEFRNRYFPVPRATIWHREYSRVFQRVSAVINPEKWVGIR